MVLLIRRLGQLIISLLMKMKIDRKVGRVGVFYISGAAVAFMF